MSDCKYVLQRDAGDEYGEDGPFDDAVTGENGGSSEDDIGRDGEKPGKGLRGYVRLQAKSLLYLYCTRDLWYTRGTYTCCRFASLLYNLLVLTSRKLRGAIRVNT